MAESKKTQEVKAKGLSFHQRLVKAFAEMPSKLEMAQGYGYKYTPLPVIMNAIRPILSKYGLALRQEVSLSQVEGRSFVLVSTIIYDEEGNELKSPQLAMPIIQLAKANEAQSAGASITYARRYSLSAFLGIATEEDTDAHANGSASHNASSHPEAKAVAPKSNGHLSEKQIKYLFAIAPKYIIEKCVNAMGAKELKEIKPHQFDLLLKMVQSNVPDVPDDVSFALTSILGMDTKSANQAWLKSLKKYNDEAKAHIGILAEMVNSDKLTAEQREAIIPIWENAKEAGDGESDSFEG